MSQPFQILYSVHLGFFLFVFKLMALERGGLRGLSCRHWEKCRSQNSSRFGWIVVTLAVLLFVLPREAGPGSRAKHSTKHHNTAQVLHICAVWFAVTSLPTPCSLHWLLLLGYLGSYLCHQHL